VSEAEPNVKDESHVMNMIVIEFYTLIAMACMQGAMLSSDMMNRCLPNISNRGKRVAVAPTRKSTLVASYLLAGYTMLFFSVILLIVFMRFILGVEFGANLGLIIVLAATGSLTATMMGMFLSTILKTNDAAKNVTILIVTMVGCLFAGMFGGMKIFFDEACPWMNKINPVGLITDGFYSLLYYDDMTRFIVNALSLVALAAIFFVLSVRNLRRARYDSV
jgi:ABC-2 type transport system permease protein